MAQHPAHAQTHRHLDQPSPIDVQKALGGATYPTTRDKLVETARGNGADQEVLPDKNYDSPAAVSKQISRTP
jgi:hypothetical protein